MRVLFAPRHHVRLRPAFGNVAAYLREVPRRSRARREKRPVEGRSRCQVVEVAVALGKCLEQGELLRRNEPEFSPS
ncbi:MAG TPA: hypothetical protein VGP93_04875, partial [Polyangiaceae bacterium]|nr:hypothetical protein [Polyangiaceae bacterium]